MREDFLHFVWQFNRYEQTELRTTQGESITLLAPGQRNSDAGPDFSNVRLAIGETLWAGNVEIHLKSSDWFAHGHQYDPAYQSVVLHVVLEEDRPACDLGGRRLPCLELRHRLPAGLLQTYWRLQQEGHWIPCRPWLAEVPQGRWNLWLDRLIIERLEQRTLAIRATLEACQCDWEETFYRELARSFGLQVNTLGFEMLARSLPLQVLLRHQQRLPDLEALLFGQSGLLDSTTDAYPRSLQKRYRTLRTDYCLEPIPPTVWKYARLRPANFPTVRIAQFATLIHRTGHLFSKAVAARNWKELEAMFQVQLSDYWMTHYRFDQPSIRRQKRLGKDAIRTSIINTIIPILFLYGQTQQDADVRERALHFLERMPPEHNHILRQWAALGRPATNSYEAQALLQLKKHYCDQRRCLNCQIGMYFFRKGE